MKKLYSLLVFILMGYWSNAQETIFANLTHDGIERDYIVRLPIDYNETDDAVLPLVLNLHGRSSNNTEQIVYGNFQTIADENNFILVVPQGTLDDTGTTYWNAQWGGETDDIGFLDALLDEMIANYNVDTDRIYSTGMSNGGFMSYTLACVMSDRIAAIASVTGTMTRDQLISCNPERSVPVMQIHGTADPVVPYDGNTWMAPIEDAVDYWVNYNECDPDAQFTALPDINTSDDSTVERFVYPNGNNNSRVELYKVINGGHTWPGTFFAFPGTNYDFDASLVIWEFFSQFSLADNTLNVGEHDISLSFNLSPNPVSDELRINSDNGSFDLRSIQIIDVNGKLISIDNSAKNEFNLSNLNPGSYILRFEVDGQEFVEQFIKI